MDKRFRERPENGLLMTNNGRSRKEPTVLFAPAETAEGSPQPEATRRTSPWRGGRTAVKRRHVSARA